MRKQSKRCGHRDPEATAAAGFKDSRSFITFARNGHGALVFLFGDDMSARRLEVYERSKGRCEECNVKIWWESFHLHHKKHRGRGGDDSLENFAAICFDCHFGEGGHHGLVAAHRESGV